VTGGDGADHGREGGGQRAGAEDAGAAHTSDPRKSGLPVLLRGDPVGLVGPRLGMSARGHDVSLA
jgi:hypothetical protein